MNATVFQLTARGLLGRRRALVLLLLPGVLVGLALLIRLTVGTDELLASDLLGAFALGTLMPLVGLIAGTGVVGPEIDDGSIVYLLAKPLRRSSIVVSKLAVSIAAVAGLGVLPVFLAAVLMSGEVGSVAIAYTAGAVAAAVAYSAVFLALAVVTRNAVVVGLLYALVWEALIGQIAPGAQVVSIQQWSLAVAEWAAGGDATSIDIGSAVELRTALVLLAVVIGGSAWLATRRLRTIHLTEEA